MALFRVRFMNQFPNKTGHDHPVCQREIEVITNSEDEAIAQAIREFQRHEAVRDWRLRASNIECRELPLPPD